MQVIVEAMLADKVAQKEETYHLGHTMTAYKLPHPFIGSLHQKGMYGLVVVCIVEPAGKVLFRDAASRRLGPPRLIAWRRPVGVGQFLDGIEAHRQYQHAHGDAQQPFVRQRGQANQ